jgi:general secretion pathway protein G
MVFAARRYKGFTENRTEELSLLFRYPLELYKRKGFTLVELLIVIIIIGILSSSLLLVAGQVEEKSTATRIISEARTMKAAALLYYSEHNSWPIWAWTGHTYINGDSGKDLPSKYVDRLPVNDSYWLGVMNDSPFTSGDVTAAVVLFDSELTSGVRLRISQMAEEMGIYAVPEPLIPSKMDFSKAYTYTESDNNMVFFITDRP